MKTIVVMPAYNAQRTLKTVFADIRRDIVDEIILCDDFSSDRTSMIARSLGIDVIRHKKNMGYGANQKTLYKEALKRDADIVVMLHADNQYDAAKIPQMIAPIKEGRADCVLGSRILGGKALKGGMPVYKYISNRVLTFLQNRALNRHLSEYHTGLRAFSRKFLETVPWQENSNNFLFDAQILIQAVEHDFKIEEIPIPTRYFPEASEVGLLAGIKYGLGILSCLVKYIKENPQGFLRRFR
ncbi:MAG: glycosyltransferase family 2 protein [Candidatus Omnitrophota bacterium]